MKDVSLIKECINKRIEFLESLILVCSYQDIVDANPNKLRIQSEEQATKQNETIMRVLRTFRVDDSFKKNLHASVLRSFKRIETRYNSRREATGSTKDMVADYTKFFTLMKEKNILEFLSHIFDVHAYNQTTIVYVLIEILLKFLRLKCVAFIKEKIKGGRGETPKEPPQSPSLSNTLIVNNKRYHQLPSRNCSAISSDYSRLKSIPNSETQKIARKSRLDSFKKQRESLELNCHTIPTDTNESREALSRLRQRKVSLSLARDQSTPAKSKRRVIKSFLNVKEETNLRIQKNNSIMRQWNTGLQTNFRVFCRIYSEEWRSYLELVCLEFVQEEDGINYSNVKKKEWMRKNKERMMFEACSRNDNIRREMEQYADAYNSKFKK